VVVVLPHQLSADARAASLNDLLAYIRMTTPPRPSGLLSLPFLKRRSGPECGWLTWRNRDPFVPSATLRSRRAAGLSRTLLLVRDRGHLPNPGEFATAAEQAASARAASNLRAHAASQIDSIVTVLAADQPVAHIKRSRSVAHQVEPGTDWPPRISRRTTRLGTDEATSRLGRDLETACLRGLVLRSAAICRLLVAVALLRERRPANRYDY
jgi:hypothetical protein